MTMRFELTNNEIVLLAWKRSGLTQRGFAELFGVTREYFNKCLNNRVPKIYVDKALELLSVCSCDRVKQHCSKCIIK